MCVPAEIERIDAGKLLHIKTFSKLASVKVLRGESFLVDVVGFVFIGKRWSVSRAPTASEIADAKKLVLRAQASYGKRGAGLRVSLYEVKKVLEDRFPGCSVSNGAMILAASQLGWSIEQEDINGIVVVDRRWWKGVNV